MSERLRITGGTHRGRRLFSPPKDTIRPASDMIRQAVFNMLGKSVEGAFFYDVFAGTGIVGMEALSRGARRAVFVEKEKRQVSLIHRNLDHAGFGPEASVRGSDAFTWGKHFRPDAVRTIVFLGPPYPLFQGELGRMLDLISNLQNVLREQDALVLQFPSFIQPETIPRTGEWYRFRKYGVTRVGIWDPEMVREPGDLDADEGEEIDDDFDDEGADDQTAISTADDSHTEDTDDRSDER